MNYNFDIIVAGCNTNCLHCYVNGGPAKQMEYEDYILCLNKLRYIFDKMEKEAEVSITIDNEIFNHPRAKDIIINAREIMKNQFYNHGSTTGIAIMNRNDRDEIADTLLKYDCKEISFSIHGNESHHNEIVKNPIAFASIKKGIDYFSSRGFNVIISLILSKYLVNDKEFVTSFLEEAPHNGIYIAIPNYVPTNRMRKYQSLRANYEECLSLKGYISKWGWNEDRFFNCVENYNEKAIYNMLKNDFNYNKIDMECPKDVYLNIDQQLNLYYGNTGASIKALGNLKNANLDDLVNQIKQLKPNYSFTAYYNLQKLPKSQSILEGISTKLDNNYVYPSTIDCLCRWFDRCGIENMI